MTDVLLHPPMSDTLENDHDEILRLEREIAEAERRAQEEEEKVRKFAEEAQAADEEVRAVDVAASTDMGDDPADPDSPTLLTAMSNSVSHKDDNSVSTAAGDDTAADLHVVDVVIPPMPPELAHLQKEIEAIESGTASPQPFVLQSGEVIQAIDVAQLIASSPPPRKSASSSPAPYATDRQSLRETAQPVLAHAEHVSGSSSPPSQTGGSSQLAPATTVDDLQQFSAAVSQSVVTEAPSELTVVAEEPAGADPALLEQISQWQSRYIELLRKHKALESLHEESQDLEKELEEHVQLLEREAAKNRDDLAARTKDLAEAQARLKDVALERAELEKRLQDTESLLEKMVQHQEQSKAKNEKKLTDLTAAFENANKRLAQADSEVSHLQREIQRLTTDQVVLKQEIRHLEAENDKFQKKARMEKGYHEAFEKKYNDAEERLVLMQQELVDVQTEKAEVVRRLNEEIPHEQQMGTSQGRQIAFPEIEEQIQKLTTEQRQVLLRKFTVEELSGLVPTTGALPTVSEAVMLRQGTMGRAASLAIPPIPGMGNLIRAQSVGRAPSFAGIDRPFESNSNLNVSPRRQSTYISPREVLENAAISAAAVKAAAPQSIQVYPLQKGARMETGLTGMHLTDASGRPLARVVEDKTGLVIQPLMEGGAPNTGRGGGDESEAQGGVSGTNDPSYVHRRSTVTGPSENDNSGDLEDDPSVRASVSTSEHTRLMESDRYKAYGDAAGKNGASKRACCGVGSCGGRQTAANESGCAIC